MIFCTFISFSSCQYLTYHVPRLFQVPQGYIFRCLYLFFSISFSLSLFFFFLIENVSLTAQSFYIYIYNVCVLYIDIYIHTQMFFIYKTFLPSSSVSGSSSSFLQGAGERIMGHCLFSLRHQYKIIENQCSSSLYTHKLSLGLQGIDST